MSENKRTAKNQLTKSADVQKKISNKILPHNLEAEQSLLGCLLIDGDIAIDALPVLKSDDFYTQSHRTILEALKSVQAANKAIDIVTVTDALERNGQMSEIGSISYLTTLTTVIPSTANYKEYLDIVKRDSTMRKLIRGATEIIEFSYVSSSKEQAVSFAEKQVFDINESNDEVSFENIRDTMFETISYLTLLYEDKNAFRGYMTGFSQLDKMTNGLHKGDLVLIAARPGIGKTSLAMNIIERLALYGNARCAVFSLEMPRRQLAQRMLSSVSNVSMSKLTSGDLDADDWTELYKAHKIISDSKIYINDSSMITTAEIMSKCRRLKLRGGLDAIMVDYIQLMNSASKRVENRQQEISDITRNLKIIAKELDVPVIALSQLNRAMEKSARRPMLSDLRESGAIEQDADIVMFLHRKSDENTPITVSGPQETELIIAKHRNGPTGVVNLLWLGDKVKYVSQESRIPPASRKKADKPKEDSGGGTNDADNPFSVDKLSDLGNE